jgi:hypothetical protein
MNEDIDIQYLRECLQRADFLPIPWEHEDKNLGAFRSKEELISWFCQPPGVVDQPYRDRAFYTRELAHISRIVQPRTVVEFGTFLGMGTCLLRWLNLDSVLVTVDNAEQVRLYDNRPVPVGYLARLQGIPCAFIRGASWEYKSFWAYGTDLCFIDADHSYEAVLKDSICAWQNRSTDGHKWAIIWHDYNDRHPGVMHAVGEFCIGHDLLLRGRPDSDTVWIIED